MSVSGQCNHTFGPNDTNSTFRIDSSELDDDGKWHCPHPTPGDDDYCIFHQPPGEFDCVSAEFVRLIRGEVDYIDEHDSPKQRLQFIDANFNSFILRYTNLDADSNFPIDLRYSQFNGRFDLSFAEVSQPIKLDDCTFKNGLLATSTSFSGRVDCRNVAISQFAQPVTYEVASTGALREFYNCAFPEATFEAPATFGFSEVDSAAFFKTEFRKDIEFRMFTNLDYLDLESCLVQGILNISGDTIRKLMLSRGDFNREVALGTEEIGTLDIRKSHFQNQLQCFETHLTDCSSKGAVFEDDARFVYCEFEDRFELEGVRFRGSLTVESPNPNTNRSCLSLSQSTVAQGSIEFYSNAGSRAEKSSGRDKQKTENSDKLTVDLSAATVGDIEFRTSEDSIWKNMIIHKTEFSGFKFEDYVTDLQNIEYDIHLSSEYAKERIFDSNIDFVDVIKKERKTRVIFERIANSVRIPQTSDSEHTALISTYLQMKNGATDSGDKHSASEFFIREYYFRQKQAKSIALNSAETLDKRLTSLLRWLSYMSLATTSSYGERTRRVGGFSIGLILLFAVFFFFAWNVMSVDPQNLYVGVTGVLLLSIESFTTLVLGGTTVQEPLIRLLADIEGFLGAFFISLFVFSLTRSIHR